MFICLIKAQWVGILLLLLLQLLVSFALWSGTTHWMRNFEALKLALNNNPKIAISCAEIDSATSGITSFADVGSQYCTGHRLINFELHWYLFIAWTRCSKENRKDTVTQWNLLVLWCGVTIDLMAAIGVSLNAYCIMALTSVIRRYANGAYNLVLILRACLRNEPPDHSINGICMNSNYLAPVWLIIYDVELMMRVMNWMYFYKIVAIKRRPSASFPAYWTPIQSLGLSFTNTARQRRIQFQKTKEIWDVATTEIHYA